MKLTYDEAMKYMKETEQYGSVLGLDNIKELLQRLSNPQNKLKFIHVAGTNGKGSVSAYISSILAVSGYKTGRYVSPAVQDYCEKIQISEKYTLKEDTEIQTKFIEEEKVAYYLGKIKEVIEDMVSENYPHPTSFEMETAMSFLYFLDCDCDFVVLEVGLGGRLDATNVINTTICSVITSISMDHTEYLGNTLEKIAFEKAGIIKEFVPVVSYNQEKEAETVIKEIAEKNQAQLTIMSMEQLNHVKYDFCGTTFDYKRFNNLEIMLLGENQVKNAALAIEVATVLNEIGYPIHENHITAGLKLTRWSGRFEMIFQKPYVFIDGAHNEEAAKSLKESISIYFQKRRLIYIVGVFADKDYKKILRYTAPYADVIITIAPNNSRALTSEKLAKEAKLFCNHVIDGNTAEEAVKIALKIAGADDVILAFGSLSFLGELKNSFYSS